MSLVLGIDIGGTGSRAALGMVGDIADPRDGGDFEPSNQSRAEPHAAAGAGLAPRIIDRLTGPRIEIGPNGSNVLHVLRTLVRSAAGRWVDRFTEVTGIGIGATGIASLAESPSNALADISTEFGVPAVAAIDAVTAHLGALGGTGGAISVLGTGAIAIAHPGPNEEGIWTADWSRADGWGHLFGDRGGGAWLGRRGLELALRTHDGLDEHGRAVLEAATRRFGHPASWPGQFYTRSDRAGLLAEFAADIAHCARAGDAASVELLGLAGREAARSALAAARAADADTPVARSAVAAARAAHADTSAARSAGAATRAAGADDASTLCSAGEGTRTEQAADAAPSPVPIALTGGVAAAGSHLVEGFRTETVRLHPHATIAEPAGGPLDGALTLGHLGAGGKLRAQERTVWL